MTRKRLPSSDNKLTRTCLQGSLEGWLVSISLQSEGWPERLRRPLQPKRPLKPQSRGRKEQERAGWSICFSVPSHLWSQTPQALGRSRASPGTQTSLRS